MKLLKASSTNSGDGFTAPHRIVLREDEFQYVTHFHNLQADGYCHGHYFPKHLPNAFNDAVSDFVERCKASQVSPEDMD